MLMDPVMVGTADRYQVLDRVCATLRATQDVMRVDRSVALDIGDEALGSTSLISCEDLISDISRHSERFPFPRGASDLLADC